MIYSSFYPVSRNFDDIFEKFTAQTFKSDEHYPPYNIYTDNNKGIIEIAVAGFSENDLKVYFDEDGYLVIDGSIEKNENKEFAHRGLSFKKFKRKFKIDKHYEVKNVFLKNGLLTIELNENVVEPQIIPINTELIEDKGHEAT